MSEFPFLSFPHYGCHVIKEVPKSMFRQMHWRGLKAAYAFMLKRHGSKASQGCIRPMNKLTVQAQHLDCEAASWLIMPATAPRIPDAGCRAFKQTSTVEWFCLARGTCMLLALPLEMSGLQSLLRSARPLMASKMLLKVSMLTASQHH